MPYLWGIVCLICHLLSSVPVSYTLFMCNSSSSPLCHKHERLALLDFKNSFTINSLASVDCSDQLAIIWGHSNQVVKAKTKSWHNDIDCCEWDGVTCHPLSGHVISLDLSCAQLSGTIGPNNTLFQLHHLKTLNLAFNDFHESYISPQYGKLIHLTDLNLSGSWFTGTVSSEISLQRLVSLDLSYNDLDMPNFKVIAKNLTALTHLKLDNVDINSDIPQSLVNNSCLIYLSLNGCSMRGTLPPNILNLPQLQVLRVNSNANLSINIKSGNWSSSLEILDLSFLNISNQLPYSLGQSKPLRELNLHGCKTYGTIPPWVWNISEIIELGDNYLTGNLPSKLVNVPSLLALDLSSNNLNGNFKLNMFSEAKNLRALYLSNSGLSDITTNTDELNSTLVWPQIDFLGLSSCNISAFPSLSDPKFLLILDLSNNNIQGEIPKWIHNMAQLWDANNVHTTVNLSHNFLTHGLEHLPWKKLSSLDLSSNMLQEPLPIFPSNSLLEVFYASNNKLKGTFDPSVCNLNNIAILDLSNNTLAGEIPICLPNASIGLIVLNLQSNRLSGTIQAKFSKSKNLNYLDLSDNQFEGMVPRSLSQCQSLQVLNLGNNRFNGAFPSWVDNLPRLEVLNLRCNSFQGPIISSSKVQHPFSQLQIIDLSNNKFTGKLPLYYISNFTAMMNLNESNIGSPQYMGSDRYTYLYSIELTYNGQQQKYVKIITTLSTFDMSNNNFEGDIPTSIGGLHTLRGLNLSHNLLNGHIPPSIANLTLLDCLDLSSNKLTGPIPQELVKLTFLGVFNVSENLLEGPIPHGNNFDTFSVDSYIGNLGLCGQPLLECGGSHSPSSNNARDNQNASDDDGSLLPEWEIILMGFSAGLVVGLAWGYYMLSVGNPFWFIKIADRMELAMLGFGKKHVNSFGKKHVNRRGRRVRTGN